MAHNHKSKSKHVNLNHPNNLTSIKNEMDSQYSEAKQGIIKSLCIMGDKVFAVVVKDHPPDKDQYGNIINHGEGYFNVPEGLEVSKMVLPELLIQTDLDPINCGSLKLYIGHRCSVTVKSGMGMYAHVDKINAQPTIFNPVDLQMARLLTDDGDIMGPDARNYLKNIGYADTDIDTLYKMTYDQTKYDNILISFEGEAKWHLDAAVAKPGETELPATPILVGLNQAGMKTKLCHLPPKFISGK